MMWQFNLLADVWSWLVPAVIIVVYIISHLWSAAQGGNQQGQQGQQRPNQPQRRRPPPPERTLQPQPKAEAAEPPSNQAKLNAEIEQFLKRANERRMEKARRESPGQRTAQPVAPPSQEVPVDIEPLERRDFDAVAASVLQHFGGRTHDELNKNDVFERAEQELDKHLNESFGHRMGTLGASDLASPEIPVPEVKPPDVAEDRAAAAQAIAGLLVNQQSLRQAVLLKEILERPIDRW